MSLLIFVFPLQKQWELWHFREGVENQGLCLPLKPNMQKDFPVAGEDTAPSLHGSLEESRLEGGKSRRTPLLLSTLTGQMEQRTLPQALHSWLCHQVKGAPRMGEEWREDSGTPQRSVLQEDSERLTMSPWALSCTHAQQGLLYCMQTTPLADLYFRSLPGIWATTEVAVTPGFTVFLPAQLQL